MSLLIRLDNIHKHYATAGGSTPVLQNISLDIHAGEALAVTGASGSGKSTLMNIIGLLDRFTTGHYYLQGENVSGLTADQCAERRNRTIGFVFQSFYLLPRLTALENVMLPLLYRQEKKESASGKARHFLSITGMGDLMDRKPSALSGGQQQRVAIARALAGSPQIILADEPTGALDSQNARLIMDLLFELNQTKGTTLLVVTHDPVVYDRFPRRLSLHDGQTQP